MRRVTLLLLATSLSLLPAAMGCLAQSRNQKIKDVHIGMTVQDAEDVLGEPLDVYPGVVPTFEQRDYKGDGNDTISVTFEKGIVEHVHLRKPKFNWPPVS